MAHVVVNTRTCIACRLCELACSSFHEGVYSPHRSRLHIDMTADGHRLKPRFCLQANCAKCETACPEGAIVREVVEIVGDAHPFSGHVLRVDEERCTDCGECYAVCPTGVIRRHPDRAVAFKCDLCGGQPQCVAFCQNPQVRAVQIRLDKVDRETGTVSVQ
jgi:Fe-S-cluster-containing hydrogenase component 2